MPDRSRTCNLLLRRQALYPLSYGHAIKHSLSTGPVPKSSQPAARVTVPTIVELFSRAKPLGFPLPHTPHRWGF